MPHWKPEPDRLRPRSFEEEESDELRDHFGWLAVRLAAGFALLVAGVYFAFWWSGSAVRFSAARVADRAVPTWRVRGNVSDRSTGRPIPWARIQDDPSGQPPFYATDAGQFGEFELSTLPEPHRIRVSAPGYRPVIANIGRRWFLWLPRGSERLNIMLTPE